MANISTNYQKHDEKSISPKGCLLKYKPHTGVLINFQKKKKPCKIFRADNPENSLCTAQTKKQNEAHTLHGRYPIKLHGQGGGNKHAGNFDSQI